GGGGAARRWLLVAGAGAGVLLAALSLPLPGVPGGTEAERRGGLSAVRALIGGQWGDVYALNRPLGSNGERRYPQGLGENPTHGYAPPAPSQFDNNRAFVGGLLVLLAFAWLLWRSRERRKGGGRPAWWEVAALAGVLLAGGLLVLGSLSGDPRSLEPSGGYAKLGVEGEKGLLTGGGNSSVLPTQGQGWLNRFNDVAFVLLLLAAVLLAWAGWRLNRPARPEEDAPAPLLAPTLEDATALHRVRRTYRSALAALTRAGLGRAPDETPAEHAARVSAARPDLAGALSDLLAAYTPVRYGLSSSEEGAERAEGAARTLARLARPTSAPGAAGSALG
ncbi:hypothetical protein RDMS_05945, partial [Deinococcus sp. RL]|uniref:DUF4129 domain-containing protein n=1 Tax=Deinococcus sp. RL TaxID=1489678 RepID=UPI0004D7A4C8